MYIDLGFRRLTMVQSENLVATLINLLAFNCYKEWQDREPCVQKTWRNSYRASEASKMVST